MTISVCKLATTRLVKGFLERWSWAKFDDAVEGDDGARRTMVSTEEIVLEKPRPLVTSSNTYVPPSKRLGAERSTGTDMRRRNDDNSVRVEKLSEDTCDADLKDLFGTFRPVLRAHVVKDYKTGLSRGFGFVNFVSREDAQRTINNLNGYGYHNLILDG
ncbi:hypothetical protein RJ639_032169 [Escallonia herrerae]|uniref:RRM domain-containing protein n=1 Tax=Escallonia herrerae TaxID=1293975 RepID=A0AA88WWI4_9ASTE|nr:hypothetical protein RJ639_032169 [Escallonia herrerae]